MAYSRASEASLDTAEWLSSGVAVWAHSWNATCRMILRKEKRRPTWLGSVAGFSNPSWVKWNARHANAISWHAVRRTLIEGLTRQGVKTRMNWQSC